MKIVMLGHYLHNNNLVKVVGAHGMDNPATMTFGVEWHVWDGTKDVRHTAECTRHDLQEAPTLERLHYDYHAALEVVRKQAVMIEQLEEEIEQWKWKFEHVNDDTEYT